MIRALSVLALFVAVSGCSTPLRYSRIRPDYARIDRELTKRLLVVTSPNPDDDAKLGELWSTVARRYINGHRQFIAKASQSAPEGPAAQDPVELCSGEEYDGVVWLKPTVVRHEGANVVRAAVAAKLLRCRDGGTVWAAGAEGTFKSDDPEVKELAEIYVAELGEEIRPWFPATFKVLKAALDTMPDPLLTEADKDEKIELGE